jgi:alpha-tubulin suppressor-like RCC1 family protein
LIIPMRRLGLLAFSLGLVHCSDSAGPPAPVVPAAIAINPDSISIRVGQQLQMHAVVLDSAGDTIATASPTWSSSDTAVMTVSNGLVTARSHGTAFVTAHLDTLADSAYLRVLIPVARVTLSPFNVRLVPGGTIKLTATIEGADGSILSDRDVAWNTSTGVLLSITASGMVKALQEGEDTVRATSEGVGSWNRVRVQVTRPTFVRIASGEGAFATCALTTEQSAFCWGWNSKGGLGTGTYGDSTGAGGPEARYGAGIAYPTGVLDLSAIASIITSDGMTCAVAGSVYCWGINDEGSLGTREVDYRNRPGRVAGLGSMKSVVAGSEWGCALGTDSIAYCWGGSATGFLVPPQAVSSRTYLAISGGWDKLCGIGSDSLAYCGYPSISGQTLVSSSLKFTAITAGYHYACGITTDSTAYCWGTNSQGQLGDGTTVGSAVPVPVAGGMKFVDIAAGSFTTCGIAAGSSIGHCWGGNYNGSIGRETPVRSMVPLPITGDLALRQVTVGAGHACGISLAGKAYCWGQNSEGQLGDGTTINRFAPVLVVGQQP